MTKKSMFNNNKLPLNKVQRFQAECAKSKQQLQHNQKVELALWQEYMNGNEDAGWELFKSYKDIVAYIYRNPHKAQFKNKTNLSLDWTPEDKEDLFQEIAYQFFKLLGEYDPEAGDVVAVMKGKLHLRVYASFFEDVADRKLNEVEFDEEEGLKQKMKQYKTGDEEEVKKLPSEYVALYEALDKLTGKQREIIEMTIVRGWNASEIAEELDMKPPAVRKAKERGLERLKKLMGVG